MVAPIPISSVFARKRPERVFLVRFNGQEHGLFSSLVNVPHHFIGCLDVASKPARVEKRTGRTVCRKPRLGTREHIAVRGQLECESWIAKSRERAQREPADASIGQLGIGIGLRFNLSIQRERAIERVFRVNPFAGGELHFTMQAEPNRAWGQDAASRPSSMSTTKVSAGSGKSDAKTPR